MGSQEEGGTRRRRAILKQSRKAGSHDGASRRTQSEDHGGPPTISVGRRFGVVPPEIANQKARDKRIAHRPP